DPVTRDHPTADRARDGKRWRRAPPPRPSTTRPPYRTRARGRRRDRTRQVQRRNQPRTLHEHRHGEGARLAPPREVQIQQPRPDRFARTRRRRGLVNSWPPCNPALSIAASPLENGCFCAPMDVPAPRPLMHAESAIGVFGEPGKLAETRDGDERRNVAWPDGSGVPQVHRRDGDDPEPLADSDD